jgi:hypothetical protein
VSGYSGFSGPSGYSGYSGPAQSSIIVLGGAGGWPSTTSGAFGPLKAETATNKINTITIDFTDTGVIQYAEWGVFMPPAYAGGTVTATFVWLAPGTSTNSVVWGCAARAYTDLQTLDQAFGTLQSVTDAHSATASQVQISAATSAITIGGSPGASTWVQFRCFRDSSNGSDTLAATASLLAVIITY